MQQSTTTSSPTSYQASNGDWLTYYPDVDSCNRNLDGCQWIYFPHDEDRYYKAKLPHEALYFCDDPEIVKELFLLVFTDFPYLPLVISRNNA